MCMFKVSVSITKFYVSTLISVRKAITHHQQFQSQVILVSRYTDTWSALIPLFNSSPN